MLPTEASAFGCCLWYYAQLLVLHAYGALLFVVWSLDFGFLPFSIFRFVPKLDLLTLPSPNSPRISLHFYFHFQRLHCLSLPLGSWYNNQPTTYTHFPITMFSIASQVARRCATGTGVASQARHQLQLRAGFAQTVKEGLTATDAWSKSCYSEIDYTINENLPVYEAVQKFAAYNIGCLVTTDDDGKYL